MRLGPSSSAPSSTCNELSNDTRSTCGQASSLPIGRQASSLCQSTLSQASPLLHAFDSTVSSQDINADAWQTAVKPDDASGSCRRNVGLPSSPPSSLAAS
ncbi:hypothetical protein NX059_006368 [Plenodomus lindquistii]|nr:hypothetical protein NX059_006368 [Plenodomus lindquistii]